MRALRLAVVAVLASLALASPPMLRAAGAAPAAAGGPRPAELAALLARADEAYVRRDAPGAVDTIRAALDRAEALAPDAFDVLWRQARLAFWLADDPALSDADKSRLGKRAWEYGDRAAKADPGRVEGWHYAAAGIGMYALGIGIFRALGEGIEGKFKERLQNAEQRDPDFSHGAIQTAWGRFWFKLPWPKYDGNKARRALRAALSKNPDNVRAHVYLADVHRKENRLDEARSELEQALAHPPGRYDAPEERRMQAVARTELAQLSAQQQQAESSSRFAPGSTGSGR